MYLKEKETIPVRVSYKRETFLTSAKERDYLETELKG